MGRGVRALAAGAVLLVVAAGCGGSSGEKVTVDATPAALRHAAQATLDKKTSKVEFTMTMTIQGHEVKMPGSGQLDNEARKASMTFEVKDLFAQLASDAPPEAAALFDQPLEMVLDGTVMYMHFPALTAVAGQGKEWLKIDLAANKDVGALLGAGGGGFGSDPSSFLQFLEGAGKITEVGKEDVRDVPTTHFSGSYTMKDALSALPSDQRDKAEQAFNRLGLPSDFESTDIPFDAWVDADGLIRKVQMSFDYSSLVSSASSSGAAGMSMTMEYFDFGVPVDIQVPSDDEVQDASNLFSSTGSKFSSVGSSIN